MKKHGHASGAETPTYKTWKNMKSRCLTPTNPDYQCYGGRGITVDIKWHSFPNFLADMGEKPEGYELDRIDTEKGYSKENCQWVTSQWNKSKLRREYSNNTSGFKGVSRDRNSWRAFGRVDGLQVTLYCGPSFEDACKARKVWEERQYA